MTERELLVLAEAVRSSVEELANTHMSLTLEDWCRISGCLLQAADALEANKEKKDV